MNDDAAIVLEVKVILKASHSEVVGWEGDHLRVRLNAVPEKGQANAELIKVLAKVLGVAKAQVSMVRGTTSRRKVLKIVGITPSVLEAKLPPRP